MKMDSLKGWLLAVVLMGSGTVFAQVDDTSWSTLTKDNYSIHFPSDWTPNTSGDLGTSFFLLAPKKSGDQAFQANVSLVVEDMKDQEVLLDEWVQYNIQTLRTTFPSFVLLSSETMKDELGEYQRLVYTEIQQRLTLKFIQLYRIRRKGLYILTFESEDSQFIGFRSTGEKILASFRFK